MKWKFKDWGEKFADVTINFEEDEDEVSPKKIDLELRFHENSIFVNASLVRFQNILNFNLVQEVVIEVSIRKIPAYDTYGKHIHLDNLENGWRQNIFERISKTFGYPLKK